MSNRKKRKTVTKPEKRSKEGLPCSEYANPGTVRMIMTSKLISGMPYQRPVEDADVNHLIAEWDDRLLDPLVVSFRDGNFYLVDGQHRVCAARKMNGGKDLVMQCVVYTGLSYEDEAELCYKLDKAKKRLSLSQATNALMESGRDEEISEIKRLLEREGFVWALNKSRGKGYEITTTRCVINTYRDLGAPLFSRMLRLLDNTWHGDAASLNATMLAGLALFVKTYGNEMDDSFFATRLSMVDPAEIIRRSKADFSTNSRALRCARVLLKKYNSNRGGRKLAYRFQG